VVIASDTYDTDAIYSGFITQSGTGGNSQLPLGWTVTKLATGKYKITHNLNLADEKDLHVVANLHGQDNEPVGWRIHTQGVTVDKFVIHIDDLTLTPVDDAFYFVAIRI